MTHIQNTLDKTFAHSYECKLLVEIPRTEQTHFYYPGASQQGGRDGMLLAVQPERGASWFGSFAFGQVTLKSISGIFTTPDPECMCVVSRGEGYIVNAVAPTIWEPVRVTPIIDVRLISTQEIIVFADYTALVAYGRTGLKWKTKRLTWDNLKITEVTDTVIKGEFWDIRSESVANFVVDLVTGTHKGGIEDI